MSEVPEGLGRALPTGPVTRSPWDAGLRVGGWVGRGGGGEWLGGGAVPETDWGPRAGAPFGPPVAG